MNFDVEVSRAVPDPEWDAFLETAPGGTYHQSSIWAEVKRAVGWTAQRVVLRHDGRIAGGCQMLLRPVPLSGRIGYAPRGPVLTRRDPEPLAAILDQIQAHVRREGILYLKLQPPSGELGPELEARGFVPSALEAAPTASARISLDRPADELLRGFRRSALRNLRKAERLGVTVRIGGEEDLGSVRWLVEATSQRQGFTPYPASYHERLWRIFAARDRACLLLAEYEGRVLAAIVVIGFAGRAVYKLGAWAGTHRQVPPNELLHWTAMLWAQEQGYRYYDFDDFDLPLARELLAGRELPPSGLEGVSGFKLRLGAEPELFPGAYDYTGQRLLAGALRYAAPRIDRLRPLAERMLGRHTAAS